MTHKYRYIYYVTYIHIHYVTYIHKHTYIHIYIYIVVVLRNSQNNIKVFPRSDISISPCVVSPNLLYRGILHVIHRADDLQVAFFFIFRSFGANNNNIQLQARIILHASTILHVYIHAHIIHQARDDATSPTHTTNDTRQLTSTVWRHY